MKKQYILGRHPILSDSFIANQVENDLGQIWSVEASLDSFVPWISYVESLNGKKILVFGTGGGGTIVACALNVGKGIVYGVDISEWAISTSFKRATEYGVSEKVELRYLKTTYPLPFPKDFFDIIIIQDVIEHITDERSKYIQDIYDKLKIDGIIVIGGTPNLIYPMDYHTTSTLVN